MPIHARVLPPIALALGLAACSDSGGSSTRDTAGVSDTPDTVADTAVVDTAVPETAADTSAAEVTPEDVPPEDVADTSAADTTPDAEDTAEPTLLVGTACATTADCGPEGDSFCVPEDQFWTGGYCIATNCRDDGGCPQGSHCGFHNGVGIGACVASCDADGDCGREAYGCWDIDRDGRRECGPSGHGAGTVGSACESIDDCAGDNAARCIIEPGKTSGVCSVECLFQGDCPSATACSFRGGDGTGACISTCAGDEDCSGGFTCADRDFDGVRECWIAGDGSVPLGEPCHAASECGLGPRSLCLAGANFPGICSAVCTADADCGGAGHCVAIGGIGSGYCLAACTDDATCAAGSGCTDADGDGRTECGPDPTGDGKVGRRCNVAADCGGGDGWFCGYPDLVCTRFCMADAECGAGAHCTDNPRGPGLCVAGCADDGDCEQGNSCLDFDGDGRIECVVAGHATTPLGGPCSASPNCGPGLVCGDLGPFGNCTLVCNEPTDCPLGSDCSAVPEHGLTICLASCESDDDCRVAHGWRCFDGDGDGDKECRPFAGGTGAIGAACATTADCSGGEGAFCFEGSGAPSGVCTRRCVAQDGCAASVCVDAPGYPASKLCMADCSEGCRDSWQCTSVDPAVTTEVCLDGCAGDEDCRFDPQHPVCDLGREVCVAP